MSCNNCNEQNPCVQKTCGCPIPDLSSACVIYKGEELECIGAEIPDTVESLLKKFDEAICNKLEDILQQGDLKNIGNGIEFYAGTNNLGQREIRTLTSSDGSIVINLNTEENEVDLTFDGELFTLEKESTTADAQIVSDFDPIDKKYTFKGLKSDSINIQEDSNGNVTLEVTIPDADVTITSPDNSATITETSNNVFNLSVNYKQADVTETDDTKPSHIVNQNPVKVVTTTPSGGAITYDLTPEDNNHVILLDASSANITVNIPTSLPYDNYFVGFLQKGTNVINFTGYDIKPSGFEDEIQGEGHNAAVERIASNSYLLGALKETP